MTCDETVSGEQALVGSSESKKNFIVQRSKTVNQAEKSVEVAETENWRNFSKSTFLQLMRSSILLFPSIESCSLEKFLEKFFQVPTHFDGGSLGRPVNAGRLETREWKSRDSGGVTPPGGSVVWAGLTLAPSK